MGLQWQVPVRALEAWTPEIRAASKDKNSFDIYDVIGEDYYGGGITTSAVSAFLESKDGADVVLNINSAGGDMFEGLAIYNVLEAYEGQVKVRVVGMAASAASIIAMAGDEIEIAESAFLMIHNAWSLVVGNKIDFLKAADDFDKFDQSMSKIYQSVSGKGADEIVKMMDEETWFSGADAVDMGFATSIMNKDKLSKVEGGDDTRALRKVDVALAKSGVTRSERRSLLKDLTGTPSATKETTPSASDEEVKVALSSLLEKLNSR